MGPGATTYLGPGSGPPPTRTELTVAGPAALGPGVIAVLGVHGAGGVVVQRLDTAHRASLCARAPTALAAWLPFARDPPVRAQWDMAVPWSRCTGRRLPAPPGATFPFLMKVPCRLAAPCPRSCR